MKSDPPKKWRHLLVIEDQEGRRTIHLEASTYTIGRHPSNTIVLKSPMISRQHAVLLRVLDPNSGNFFFRLIDGDLQGKRSVNGLTVNGKPCQSHILQHKDLIVFGGDVRARYHAIANISDSGFNRYTRALQASSISDQDVASFGGAFIGSEMSEVTDLQLLRLSSFPELSPYPIIELAPNGQLTYLNPAAIQEFPDLGEPDVQHPLLSRLKSWSLQERRFSVEEINVGDRTYEVTIHLLRESQLIRCYITDITERKRSELALRMSEERYALAAEGANDGLWDWQISDRSMYYSPRWELLIGETPGTLQPTIEEWWRRVHPDDLERLRLSIKEHLVGTRPHFECEFRMKHADGSYRWMRSRGKALRNEEGQPYRMAGSMTDVTEYHLIQEQILHDALHDAMTGLPNRVLFMDRLSQAITRRMRRPNSLFAVLFLDVDRFKVINDSLGHLAGDQLLIGIGQRLTACIRAEDTIARLGGDEFAILLEDLTNPAQAIEVAERVLAALSRPFRLEGHEVFTSTSIGIAFPSEESKTAEDLLRDADTAMYRAKSLGKARYEVFSMTMRAQSIALMQIETDLRRAAERNEFLVYYQPIVDLSTLKIVGFETLLRWQHPERGIVSPSEFMTVAEETGLILPISWWVMAEACRQMQRWSKVFPRSRSLSISVNLSGRHFQQADLLLNLRSILSETEFPAERLRLEVTEGILIDNKEIAIATLEEIRAMGIGLYMDDFGTGYSSLSYLHRFPIDTIKIDRTFISALNSEESSATIVHTILMLAHSLRLKVVAEGIETRQQYRVLQALGCNYGQGYFFAHPLSAPQVEQLFASQSLPHLIRPSPKKHNAHGLH
ncbi:EAL domain-containing protein [Thermosynechococcus sichuanensis E542]|uniref:EAL domain-containing protein n=1 Tax=Thermosynechococcus sichuanensis E542 TaxID=2016101 RepID=A0A7D6JJI1_9CYAN|nr:EAL domain-containing protein [Thermosynechococcus vestitus]QLL29638.1 EAL domain-containing protein [Thermosynechococcus vestitus E542]